MAFSVVFIRFSSVHREPCGQHILKVSITVTLHMIYTVSHTVTEKEDIRRNLPPRCKGENSQSTTATDAEEVE